ncbi:MAG TPA: signal peptide peptidase SppA [Chthoniobacterales bacterium]
MKGFFKTVFATFFGLALFCGFLFVMGIIAFLGLALLGKPNELSVENGSALVFNLDANIPDAPAESEFQRAISKLTEGDDTRRYSLREVLTALDAASKDPKISSLFLTGSLRPEGYGAGFGALKEVREAILDFRKSGKKVVSYVVTPSKRDYYLASAADEVYLNPFGAIDVTGFASERTFFGDAFQKYGIGIQVTRVGKYKSFVEPFVLNKMSPENREQSQKLIDDLWGEYRGTVELTRNVSPAEYQSLADKTGFLLSEVAVQKGFATKTAYLPEVIEHLKKLAGTDSVRSHTFKQVDMGAYSSYVARTANAATSKGDSKIAIVYAEGEIVDGSGQKDNVGGDRFAKILRQIRADNNVKAVVLRVNSPGGSAVASELIQHELALLREAKTPVIVSMGTVAASGGYWISTASDRIFAEPNTITGSIGVFGLLPNIQTLANNFGVTFDSVATSKNANIFTVSRPKTSEELAVVQGFVDQIYTNFLKRVAEARKIPVDKVNEIAQGRVWSGAEAVKLGLVDETGGLESALTYAKKISGSSEGIRIVEYPAAKELSEQIAEALGERRDPLSRVFGPASRELSQVKAALEFFKSFNDPRGVYARLPYEIEVH